MEEEGHREQHYNERLQRVRIYRHCCTTFPGPLTFTQITAAAVTAVTATLMPHSIQKKLNHNRQCGQVQ